MKKYFAGITAILIFCTALMSCAANAPAIEKEPSKENPVELNILVSESLLNKYESRLASSYRNEKTNVKLNIERLKRTTYPETEDSKAEIKRLKAKIMAGNGPDILLISVQESSNIFTDINKSMEQGMFCDLTPYLKENILDNSEKYYTKVFEAGRVEQNQYILPLSFDVYCAVGEGLTEKMKNEPKETPSQFANKLLSFSPEKSYHPFGFVNTSLYLADEQSLLNYTEKKINFSEEFEKCTEFMRQINARENFDTKEYMPWIYNEYKYPFYLTGGLYAANIAMAREIKGDATQEIIHVPNGKDGSTAMIKSFAGIARNCKNKKVAAEFIENLLSYKMQSFDGKECNIKEQGFLGDTANISVNKELLQPFISLINPFFGSTEPTPKPILDDTITKMKNVLETVNASRLGEAFGSTENEIVLELLFGYSKDNTIKDAIVTLTEQYKRYFDE